ncbi:MAG: hypothetical protein NVSMB62_01510 [Acidobacteriaceae bacterium]
MIATVFVLGLMSSAAWADSIVLFGPFDVSGNGFGNNPRALTIQSHGPKQTTESGCIAPGLIGGSSACAPGDGVTGGDESSPLKFPKQAAPTLSSLGITNGNQIGILFDAVQPQNGNSKVTLDDLTLKLYNGSGLVYQVSGSVSNLTTNPGNGNSEYLFTLDSSAVKSFNGFLTGNFGLDQIALDASISFAKQSSGAESFTLVNLDPVPEPSSLLLLGSGITALAGVVRRRIVG